MPSLFAFRLGSSCFLIDVDYVRSENELRESGFRESCLGKDRLQIFHVPAMELVHLRDYLHNRMLEQGAVIDRIIYSTSMWDSIQTFIQDYFMVTIPQYPRIRTIN